MTDMPVHDPSTGEPAVAAVACVHPVGLPWRAGLVPCGLAEDHRYHQPVDGAHAGNLTCHRWRPGITALEALRMMLPLAEVATDFLATVKGESDAVVVGSRRDLRLALHALAVAEGGCGWQYERGTGATCGSTPEWHEEGRLGHPWEPVPASWGPSR